MAVNTNTYNVVKDIREGLLDVNAQELFYPIILKGLLVSLRNHIKIRGISVPHYILHTGDDRMFLEARGYDNSIEPLFISNEDTIYAQTPKCLVNPGGVTLDTGQLTSPYSIGACQITTDNGVYTLKGEFRRMPIKISVDLKYYIDSYTDMMELIQYITSNLAFIRNYDIVYLGQKIKCSYKIPDSFEDEHTMDLDGAFSDNRDHTLSLSLEIETNMPIFENKTMMSADNIIVTTVNNISVTNNIKA